MKKGIAVLLSVVMLLAAMSAGLNAYALVMCETQYVYDSPNLSWLKDLIVKENMTNVDGLSQRNTLVAKAQYPYIATAESFKAEVEDYQMLYTLDENMANVIYLYMLEMVMSFAGATDDSYSDEFIRTYLESIGIVYPETDSEETKIVARAFFSVITADESYVVKRGTGLYEAFTAYISEMLGVRADLIPGFDSDASFSDLREYVMAACKFLLFSSGYDVSASTPDAEVYRLIAIMTIRSQGITIDSGTATFEEIKNKYLCAMICKIYDVSVDTKSFEEAVKKDNLAFYLLQLIGKENGVTVRDSESYKNAFDIVSKNTHYFDLEEGEFYADIYEYDVALKYKRDRIWLYPQTLGTTNEDAGTTVNVLINGEDVRENYYVSIDIDKEAQVIPVVITVEFTDKTGSTVSSSYKLNITQGKKEVAQGSTVSGAMDSVKDYIDEVLGNIDMDSSIVDMVQNVPFELPDRILNIASLMFPNFGSGGFGTDFISMLLGYSKDDSGADDSTLGGVGGLDATDDNLSSDNTSSDGKTPTGQLNFGNLNFNVGGMQIPIKPADTVVVPDAQVQYPQNNGVAEELNWFEELISDTGTVVLLIVIMVSTFVICLGIFLRLFSAKNEKTKKEKN